MSRAGDIFAGESGAAVCMWFCCISRPVPPRSLGDEGFLSEEGGAIIDRSGVCVAETLEKYVSESWVVRLGVVSYRAVSVPGEQLVGGEALL